MPLIHRILDAIADRIHANADAAAIAAGLTVERLPNGHRRISHPDLPALLEARRIAALRRGLDPIDRALLDPATQAALNTTRRTKRPARPMGERRTAA